MEDQELILSYYVLAKTQTTLAVLHQSTQTQCSSRIRMAMRKMGTFMLLGPPTPDVLARIFTAIGMEDEVGKPLSQVVSLYARTRSFQRVAEILDLRRSNVRVAMRLASKALNRSENMRHRAVGAYVFDLIDKASAFGGGFSTREMAKQGNIYTTDSRLLGEFRINVEDPEFATIFVSRGNQGNR
jgi:hypothetical protein